MATKLTNIFLYEILKIFNFLNEFMKKRQFINYELARVNNLLSWWLFINSYFCFHFPFIVEFLIIFNVMYRNSDDLESDWIKKGEALIDN